MVPEIDQEQTTVEKKEKPESALTKEVKDFLTEMVVSWSTAVEKKTSANWALHNNIPDKAHTHMYSHTVVWEIFVLKIFRV